MAGLSVLGQNVAVCARIDFASALFAPNIPNAKDGVAVLALIESGATTAVVEVDNGINTFVVTTNQARDGTSRETLGARRNIAGAVVALLDVAALAVTIVTLVVVLAIFAALAILVVIVTVGLFRGLGRSRGLGGGRSGWGFVAAEGTGGPVPPARALRRREGIWRLVRSTAALDGEPRPVEGAVSVGGGLGGAVRPSLGKTDALGVPPEFTASTVIPAAGGEDEGNSQNQESDASNERHFGECG